MYPDPCTSFFIHPSRTLVAAKATTAKIAGATRHAEVYGRNTLNIQPLGRSEISASMDTDPCTSKLLEGLYDARPTTKILPTQLTIKISMEEMTMMVSEHLIRFHFPLTPPWGTWLEQVSTTTGAWDLAAFHAPCCSELESEGGGYFDP